MNARFATISIALSLVLAGCASQPDYRSEKVDPPTVANIDIERYAGLWYEIARYPNSFQKDCEGVTAEYTLRPDGKITVLNTCRLGDERSSQGVARIVDGANGAKLKVQFAPEWVPFASGDYWVLDLADDYSHALVGAPSGKYLWILSRSPQMRDATYATITQRAEALGFQAAPLKRTQQPE